MRLPLILSFAMLLSALFSASASADALDGEWCNEKDGKLTIDGSIIIAPDGNRVMGDYTRHRFEYTAPEGSWNAGKKVTIQQFSETLMELTVDGQSPSQWKPCIVISLLTLRP